MLMTGDKLKITAKGWNDMKSIHMVEEGLDGYWRVFGWLERIA